MATKKVVLICGAAIATSTMMKAKLAKILEENGIDAKLSTGMVSEAARIIPGADLVVTSTKMTGDYGVPIVNGLPLLTGIGVDDMIEEICSLLE